jgi:hypothetical protein
MDRSNLYRDIFNGKEQKILGRRTKKQKNEKI